MSVGEYLSGVFVDVLQGDCIRGRVRSRSKPGVVHVVEVTRYGAVCDCLGALNLRKSDFCVHARALLEKAKMIDENVVASILSAISSGRAIEAMSAYAKTNTFIDAFGGLMVGMPTLFYGPDGSGKTMAVLTIASAISRNAHVVYVNTETGDPQNRAEKIMAERMGGNLENMTFIAFASEADLHVFFGGREEGAKKKMTFKDVAEGHDVGLLAIDSITRFYNAQVNNAPPEQRPSIASRFAGKLGIWVRYLQDYMFKTKPFPVIFTAWLRSGVADVFKKKEKAEKDAAEMVSIEALKEWTGPRAIGHWCKTIYKILPEGMGLCSFTQIRGEYMGKKIICKITPQGVIMRD